MAESNHQPQYPLTDLENSEGDATTNGHVRPTDSPQDGDVLEKPEGKPSANSWMDPKAFPEGGTTAWLTVAGSSACLFVSFGWINCVGVFQEYYQTHQLKQYSASDIAWIPALQSRCSIALLSAVVH